MPGLPTITFTPDGPIVTRVGLGGEGVLRTFGLKTEARAVIQEAITQGITYFDTAPAYSGSEAYLGSIWAEQPEVRRAIFHTSKSAGRSFSRAMHDLENTLKTLHTDFLDLWQIHDVRTIDDITRMEVKGGALNAFVQAKESGVVKYIGVSGHYDPQVLETCVRNWPLDSVLLPANPAEKAQGGFLDIVSREARKKDMAVIGMKCLGRGYYVQPRSGVTPDKLIRYALKSGTDLIIVGCSTPAEVRELVNAARQPPLNDNDRADMEKIFEPRASKLTFYRV